MSLDSGRDLKERICMEAAQWLKDKGLVFNEKSVESVVEFSKVLSSFFKQGQDEKWLFRGESFLYDTPLVPLLFRESEIIEKTIDTNRTITDVEIQEVEKCQKSLLNGEIQDRYLRAFLPKIHLDDVNWLPLAGHFGFKTRMLDVTANPLVALYFACVTPHVGKILDDDDAFVYAFASDNFRPVNARNGKQKKLSDYPPIPISYMDLYDVDAKFGTYFDELPYIFEPSIPQERLQAQAGRFLFWRSHKPVLHNRQIIPIRICASEKKSILNELTAYGITKRTLFPGEG